MRGQRVLANRFVDFRTIDCPGGANCYVFTEPMDTPRQDEKVTEELKAWTAQVTRRRFIVGVGFAAAAAWARPLLGTASAALPDEFGSLVFPTRNLPGWPKAPVSFALIGDFGAGNIHSGSDGPTATINPNAQNVGEGVGYYAKVSSQAYVISVGDNVYVPYYGYPANPPLEAVGSNNPPGTHEAFAALNITPYDQAVGALYSAYIKFPSASTSVYAPHGSKKQRFFTVIGDHDWWHQPRAIVDGFPIYPFDTASYPAEVGAQTIYYPGNTNGTSYYLQYFGNQGEGSTSNNTRYWDALQDKIHWIALSSDANETILGTLSNGYYFETMLENGLTPAEDNLQNSLQGQWFRNITSQKPKGDWRFVITHYSPYTSSTPATGGHNPAVYMQWGYEDFGVDAVFSGHVHAYERLYVNGVTYVVCGAGGTFESLSEFATPVGGPSIVQVANKYGFLTAERAEGMIFFSYLSFPPHDDSTPRVEVGLSDRFVLLKKGTLNAANQFAELKTIHVTLGGGSIKLGENFSYTGDLVGRGVLTKQAKGNFTLTKECPNFTGGMTVAGGQLTLGVDQTLASEVAVTLSGGGLVADAITQNFSTPLMVQSNAEITATATTALSFADSSAAVWPGSAALTIRGTPGATSIRFGTSATGLTAKQLSRIRFQTPGSTGARLTSDGYLVRA